ncbi:ABC transporter substrate-binding protein [Nesterenkonia sp. MY13]|uniref:ABC transporter substrate-binding protein n=1 Tax=Nesterenkonia sedimenti TaxID=1463632 RepID=A0A7X8YEV7_9MICC|nr:ABC transporter substrate-binding protein [Nesterenkonia sedimenti]NLS10766.1 ABC transporter substrate-binding protein [Nesterenkonia sedimenti]
MSQLHLRTGGSFGLGSLTLASLALITACGGQGAQASGATNGEDIVTGGTLRFSVSSDQGCIDPQQTTSNDSIYSSRQLVDSLTDQDPETGEIVPWLAEEWEINDDATEFTFTLQEGATFSNGEPVDSEAVAANFDAAVELGARASLPSQYLNGYQETEVHDEHSFTVHFAEPSAQFLQATSTHSLGILAPETTAADADARCQEVIGSGPFVLQGYTQNDSISLSAREDYDWGSSLWENQKRPHVDGLEFSVVPESGVRAGSLQSGQTDAIGNIASQDQPQLEAANAQLFDRNNPGIVFSLHINHENEFLSEQEVREAISHAIDREEIVETVYTEFTPVAASILASTTPDYSDLSEHLQYDPERSAELLEAAGFDHTGEGWEREGEPLRFEIVFWDNAAANAPSVELIQQQLAEAGITVELREAPIAEAAEIQAEGNFDASWGNITRADPDILRNQFSTEGANNLRLEPGELDELLAEQATEVDPDARAEMVAEAQEKITTEYHSIPVLELTTVLATRDTVHGLHYDSGSRIHLNDTWIEDAD